RARSLGYSPHTVARAETTPPRNIMRRIAFTLLLLFGSARAEAPQIFTRPAISATQVVFGHAGDLWAVDRSGGTARQLTNGTGLESHPVFSPDGSQVAFVGEYDSNLDVYVVPIV